MKGINVMLRDEGKTFGMRVTEKEMERKVFGALEKPWRDYNNKSVWRSKTLVVMRKAISEELPINERLENFPLEKSPYIRNRNYRYTEEKNGSNQLYYLLQSVRFLLLFFFSETKRKSRKKTFEQTFRLEFYKNCSIFMVTFFSRRFPLTIITIWYFCSVCELLFLIMFGVLLLTFPRLVVGNTMVTLNGASNFIRKLTGSSAFMGCDDNSL